MNRFDNSTSLDHSEIRDPRPHIPSRECTETADVYRPRRRLRQMMILSGEPLLKLDESRCDGSRFDKSGTAILCFVTLTDSCCSIQLSTYRYPLVPLA